MAAPSKPEEITRLVLDLGRSLASHYDARLSKLELTLPQAMLLRQLGEALPMNEAAGKLHCDPSNVTGIVDRLEARGLIARQQLSKDRRVKNLVLTAKGRALKRRVDAILSSAPGVSGLAAADQAALRDLLVRSLTKTAHEPRP
jgi:DNA-binding MarR family transcriptional regulator